MGDKEAFFRESAFEQAPCAVVSQKRSECVAAVQRNLSHCHSVYYNLSAAADILVR